MSILIKGMEMPKSCSDCFMHSCSMFTDHDTCMALKKDIWKLGVLVERLEDCPLVEVPTPHGRLIDADETKEALRRAEALTRAFGYHNVIQTVTEVPTIIEAEEGSEE